MSNHPPWLYTPCLWEYGISDLPNTQTALTAEHWHEVWMVSSKYKDYHSPNQKWKYWEEEAWDKTLRLQNREKPGTPGFASWALTAGPGNLFKNKLMQNHTSQVCVLESQKSSKFGVSTIHRGTPPKSQAFATDYFQKLELAHELYWHIIDLSVIPDK